MKLDTANAPLLFDPKTWSKKKRSSRQQTINAMRRIGKVSMVEVGPDEYRTPTRKERRASGRRGRSKHPLAVIAAKRGVAC
jgi:hypothetical protein